MNNDVYIRNTKIYNYDNSTMFNPSEKYPEGLDIKIKSDKKIYDEIRNLFIDMEFDKKNIGKKSWNPFKDFIKSGDNVVIKPNLVSDNNPIDNNTDCLITNFSVIRPIIDYTLKVIGKSGTLIVGDAPVQECIFEKVIKINGLEDAINTYNQMGYNIKLVDLRKHQNPDLECKIVAINNDSSLCELDNYCKKYAITNYDLRKMHDHHHKGVHEYLLPNYILNANVIINVPKPKTHRKAGITACMKNFIGANSLKEFIPHHRNGSIHENGDEFPEKNLLKKVQSNIKNYMYTRNIIVRGLNKSLLFMEKKFNLDKYLEGSWYGNDTIWRTILDINKVILYADKDGKLEDSQQRIIFNLADMIIGGEKEGPLCPSPKKSGILVAGFNQLNMDKTICQIMGFNPKKIKYILEGYNLKKYKISFSKKYKNICNEKLENLNQKFIPTEGWADYLLDK